jgi:hypothetical protein
MADCSEMFNMLERSGVAFSKFEDDEVKPSLSTLGDNNGATKGSVVSNKIHPDVGRYFWSEVVKELIKKV